jgi:hypothetical protein
MDETSKI